MVSLKKILRQSIGSTSSTISVPKGKAIPVKSNPVIQASCSSVDADSQVSIHTFLFTESDLRHSTGSNALTSSSAKCPPVVNQSSGASRSVTIAEILVSVHTHFLLHQAVARESTRSTASTDYTPSPPVIVNQASGASRAITTAKFLDLVHSRFFIQPDRIRFSLGCSTDRSTTALMVIAHKVGRCAGKAGLYTWNSFFPEDFSSVSVDLMRLTSVIVNDHLTDFVMDSYMLFPGLDDLIASTGMILVNDKIFGEYPWLDLKLELMMLYGSLPRPPEICFTFCSCHIYTDLLCGWILHSINCGLDSEDSFRHPKLSSQGEKLKFAVDSCCLDLCETDLYSFLLLESLDFEVDVILAKFGGLQVLDSGLFRDLYVTEDAALVQHSSPCFRLISLAKQQVLAIVEFWLMNSKKIAGIKTKLLVL